MIPACILAIEDESDREYMTRLYNQYKRLMYSTINEILKEPWSTEDVLQTAVEKLILKLDLLKSLDEKRLINYIITTSRNLAYNEYNKRTRQAEVIFQENIDSLENDSYTDSIENFFLKKDEQTRFLEIWPELDPKNRYLLEAKYILGRKTPDIAKDLGIKPSSVRMAMTRARKQAHQLMCQECCNKKT